MARREVDEKNELKIHDNISDSDIPLYYRMPTTAERQSYNNESIQRKKDKIIFNHAKARLSSGMKILTGFEVGAFERKVDGQYVAFSWKEGEPNYYPEWRQWIETNAADLIMILAGHVFDSSGSIVGETEEEGEEISGK